ncbi:hypothetical protein [Pseudomonas sp. MWU16-30317]|uniref:hypothetical protein n=1 Tax=Pseudomonas sp. MWU16-30317 TaxID=2878095 RepID=UPI001CF9C811|nr:hypothetical protein [Pseudomonas sp. MWU16-30317]
MQKVTIRFAYRKGLVRVWAVLSIVWLVVVGILAVSTGGNHFDAWDFLQTLALFGVIPSFAVCGIGAAIVWVIEGFARAD